MLKNGLSSFTEQSNTKLSKHYEARIQEPKRKILTTNGDKNWENMKIRMLSSTLGFDPENKETDKSPPFWQNQY